MSQLHRPRGVHDLVAEYARHHLAPRRRGKGTAPGLRAGPDRSLPRRRSRRASRDRDGPARVGPPGDDVWGTEGREQRIGQLHG